MAFMLSSAAAWAVDAQQADIPQAEVQQADGKPGLWFHQFEFAPGIAASLFRSDTLAGFDDGTLLRADVILRIPVVQDFGFNFELLETNLNFGLFFRDEHKDCATTLTLAPVFNYNQSVSQQTTVTGIMARLDFNKLRENDWHKQEAGGLGYAVYTMIFPGINNTNGIIFGIAANYDFHIFPLPKPDSK